MECYQCLKQGESGTYSGIHWYCMKCFNRYIVRIPNMKDEQAHVKALETQEGGSHYMDMPIQPVEFIVKNSIPYREANVIKYACRHQSKNGAADIRKAIHYLRMILDDYESA